MNFYPDGLKAIVAYIEALNAAEATAQGEHLPYAREVKLTDNDDTDWGVLRDEIGGSWSWFPPEAARIAAAHATDNKEVSDA